MAMHRFRGSFRAPSPTHVLPRRRAVHDAPHSRRALEDIAFEDPRGLSAEGAPLPATSNEEPSVLVVSRERASVLPMLRELLQGEPAVSIVVDRRCGERRRGCHEVAPLRERRRAERRRHFSFYLL